MSKFLFCKTCGKRLIKVDDDGTLVFKYGVRKKTDWPVVDIHIRGTIRMMCLGNKCKTENEFESIEHNQ